MAAIYDKALKRKDFSGIIDEAKTQHAADKKNGAALGVASSDPPDKAAKEQAKTKPNDNQATAGAGKEVQSQIQA